MKLHKTKPFIVQKIWGSDKLAKLKGLSLVDLGETWEVSNLEEGPSQVNGKPLSELTIESELPYLVKFIDTNDHLSVQVHPHDDYARMVENSSGKTECWIILDSVEGAGIYLGFNENVSKESFKKKVDSEKSVNEDLVFYPVERGDFFLVPAGAIHAIGKGVTLVEIQQRSGITYRVWDWNRKDANGKGRELHIEKAMDVLDFSNRFNSKENFKNKNLVLNNNEKLISHKDFDVTCFYGELDKGIEIKGRYLPSFVVLKGSLEIEVGEERIHVNEYESAIVLEKISKANIKADKGSEWLLID
ncbi:class I mannose-6-phosphate isomerase [Bacteriovoracaceae bacterium]|nr:class I mannose-6-phosphate isomerase [Bacteriovoracaceae bacterium]